ncbi:DUF2339 domain-containing protein [Methyloligella sp. 2.7D]|uniref:DUF2339 domain-containing protein n=1 Tax=unclassified Methyloligella TaxID=2625955 RepID=UPI001ABB8B1B|nr:DUF2339 domain-containing protein [Methyloligella sp. GL2]
MLYALVLLIVALLALGFVGFWLAIGQRKRISDLEIEVAKLRRAVLSLGAPGETPDTAEAPEPAPSSELDSTPEALRSIRAARLAEARKMAGGGKISEPAEEPGSEEAPASHEEKSVAGEPEAPSPPPAPAQTIGLEERFGTQWVVWAGGIALALGGFFLLRYSIEQGWFGPGARILLGAILAAIVIAAGEWTRRNELHSRLAVAPNADIPSILTAVGTTIAYADIYAAHGLYGFIGPGLAFLLLGLVALITLAAALLHGPALAGLGLIGAFLTPAMISTPEPNYWGLYLYLAIVSAAAFALARARLWRWLAIAATCFALFWTLPDMDKTGASVLLPHLFHVIAGLCLAAALIVSGFFLGPEQERPKIDAVSSGVLAAYLLGGLGIVLATGHDGAALWGFALLVAIALAVAWKAVSATGTVLAASLFVALLFLAWSAQIDIQSVYTTWDLSQQPQIQRVPGFDAHLLWALGFAGLFGGAGFLIQGRLPNAKPAACWAAAAVFTPIALLIAVYYQIASFERSLPFAAAALVLAGLFAFATEMLSKRAARAGIATATALFAIGAVGALALALTMALEKGWLTIALALMVPGIAWIAEKRRLRILRPLAGALIAAVLARFAWDPQIVGNAIGETPILNWLLYGYGIPALAFWAAARMLRRQRADGVTRLAESATLLCTVLLFFFEIRHLTGLDIYRGGTSLTEVALQIIVWLALATGLERGRLNAERIVYDWGALILAGLALLGIGFGLGIDVNPLFRPEPVGGLILNLLLLAYAFPAFLCWRLSLVTAKTRPPAYSRTFAYTAVALVLVYLSFEVRRFYQGPILSSFHVSDAEQYTYSVVWLAFGVALLAFGIARRSLSLRAASAAVVVLTVLKVFFIDMAGLTGIYRAVSFLGLGAVLLGIGWFYQRILFRGPTPVAKDRET